MERVINEKEKEMIINFGAFEYKAEKMSSILGMSESEVLEFLRNPQSEFYKLYQSGKDKRDYVIDLKLFEMAQGGDMKALERLEKRRK